MEVSVNGISDSLSPVGVSDLGTLVYDNVVFPAGTWIDLDGNVQAYNEVKLDAVTIVVNRTKEIVISKVSGREGSIKEYITNNDFTITLAALITSPNVTPGDIALIGAGLLPGVSGFAGAVGLTAVQEPVVALSRLKRLEEVPDNVEIRSKILQNVYDITKVVVADYSCERVGSDAWSVKLELIQDRDIDLEDFA